jgi:hypothetical protein
MFCRIQYSTVSFNPFQRAREVLRETPLQILDDAAHTANEENEF